MVLVLASVGYGLGCSSDEDGGGVIVDDADSGVDSGVSMSLDMGTVDTGPAPDLGFAMRPDAGHYCAMSDEVSVAGTAVPVDPATTPASVMGSVASFSCIDAPPGDPVFTENSALRNAWIS